jgi:hypothetical protein
VFTLSTDFMLVSQRLKVQMRTTFCRIYLFNNYLFRTQHILYLTEKGGQKAKQWRDRESEGERQSVAANGLWRGQ